MTAVDWTAYTFRQPDLRGKTKDLLRLFVRPYLPKIQSVLEVGCNVGHNLDAWPVAKVVGVEPNEYARLTAMEDGWDVVNATADNLPFLDNSFDLVFTVGVLIHIGPDKLAASLTEIHRVARKLILAVEYAAEKPTPAEWRGDQIWKRNYAREFTARFPDLTVVGMGWPNQLANTPFKDCTWWLLEKTH